MSQAERPDRLAPDRELTPEDIRELVGAGTPHFALQLKVRVERLIDSLGPDHPARIEGERQITRLAQIARVTGESRGAGPLAGPVGKPLSGGAPGAADHG